MPYCKTCGLSYLAQSVGWARNGCPQGIYTNTKMTTNCVLLIELHPKFRVTLYVIVDLLSFQRLQPSYRRPVPVWTTGRAGSDRPEDGEYRWKLSVSDSKD
jgi:hypothetical protein